VFVIDGSPDRSYEILRDALPNQPFPSQLILLARNFGSFAAIRAGLCRGQGRHVRGDGSGLAGTARARDRDGQGAARRRRRRRDRRARWPRDPLGSRLPAQVFWSLYRRFVLPEMPPGGVDIFACNRAFRDQLLHLEESHSSLVAQVLLVGLSAARPSTTRPPRTPARQVAWTMRRRSRT
jgi:hypothetical protein